MRCCFLTEDCLGAFFWLASEPPSQCRCCGSSPLAAHQAQTDFLADLEVCRAELKITSETGEHGAPRGSNQQAKASLWANTRPPKPPRLWDSHADTASWTGSTSASQPTARQTCPTSRHISVMLPACTPTWLSACAPSPMESSRCTPSESTTWILPGKAMGQNLGTDSRAKCTVQNPLLDCSPGAPHLAMLSQRLLNVASARQSKFGG